MSMSLDGFVAGPEQSVDDPLGKGGTRLHEWVFGLEAFQRMHGIEGGDGIVDESTPVIEGAFVNVGATVMGRHMFGGGTGPWRESPPWNGWWGTNPPYHHPVFVVTHHARPPLQLDGGTTFHFVTDGPDAALGRAREAADGKDVSLGGGAQVARHFLRGGQVDEMTISLAPVLLGAGERLFEGLGPEDLHGMQLTKTIAARNVTHLIFARPAT
jgi:dihydrofolate reductase